MARLGLGLLFVTIWASAFTAIRGVVPEWPPMWGLTARFCCVVPVLLAILAVRGARLPSRADAARLAVMGVFGIGLYLAGAWQATASLPTGLVALISSTAPLFVAAGERLFLGQRVPPLAWAGLGLGWAGVAILGAGRGLEGAALSGILFALAGALSQATGILTYAPARGRVDPWVANAGQTMAASLTLLLLAGLTTPLPQGVPSLRLVLSLAWGVLVVGVVGYVLYFIMLRRLPPATAAALQLLAPPLAAIFGWALLGEALHASDIAGGLVTLCGLALLFRARR